jgi:hypothetical protein
MRLKNLAAFFVAAGLSVGGNAFAEARNAALVRAEKAIASLHYAEADRALTQALAMPNNDRPTLLRILELQGVVAGTLNQSERAKAFFHALLVLDPENKLGDDYAPRVTDSFRAAQKLVTDEGSFKAKASTSQVSVEVNSDPMKMALKVRFHVRSGSAWSWSDVPIEKGSASANTASDISWWAEILGKYDAHLAQFGTPEEPLQSHMTPNLVAAPSPKSETAVVATEAVSPAPPPPVVVAAPAPESLPLRPPESVAVTQTSPLRPASYVVLGGAVLTAGVGAYFGITSNGLISQINSAARNSSTNVVTGMNQREAFALNSQATTDATVANVLFGVAGALAIGGAIMWWTGGSVAVSPSGNGQGISVTGVFP